METPQSQPLDNDQVLNDAGGYVWKVDDKKRLGRFLCLGSEKGSYYVSEKQHTLENVQCVQRLIDAGRGKEVVEMVVDFSVNGRTAKQEPLLFTLSLCARNISDVPLKKQAYEKLSEVCRIPTHLFTFIEYCEKLSPNTSKGTGWGRAHRKAVSNWYLQFRDNPQKLALQVTKYKMRNGWSHRDILRLAHPKPDSDGTGAVLKYVIKGLKAAEEAFLKDDSAENMKKMFRFLKAVEEVKTLKAGEEAKVVELIHKHQLVREHIPTNFLNANSVWEALLQKMPMTAMIRNLNKMTNIQLLAEGTPSVDVVCKKLLDADNLKYARVHPFNLLIAQLTYSSGKGDKGSLTWNPVQRIAKALNEAFYLSFKYVEPTNKRYLLALDVSGSMGTACLGSNIITCMDASAAMAMVTARTERNSDIMGFSHELVPLAINPEMSLEEVVKVMRYTPMGGTDCSLPMIYATRNKKKYDVFIVYTDSETWVGRMHPKEALEKYRVQSGISKAKLIVCGMSSNEFTIADPDDPNMFDIAGFDTSAPDVMKNFVLGHI